MTLYVSITHFDYEANAGLGGLDRINDAPPVQLIAFGRNDVSESVAGMRHNA